MCNGGIATGMQSCQPGILKMREISDFHQYSISTYRRGHKTNT